MRTLLLALLFLPLIAHSKPIKKVKYLFGPTVVYADQDVVSNFCFTPGALHDNGEPIKTPGDIGACYSRETKEIWIPHNRLDYMGHELCHYYCDKAKDIDTCNKKCHKIK